MDRIDVSFRSGGERCAAWLYRPDGSGPHAGVVLAHGFGGVRYARLDAFAERFARAGFAALVFDYRHFGDSEGEPRQVIDIPRQLEDWRAALAYARSLEDIDPDRIAIWGTSFSGGHVATIAAEDRRLAAAISQAPFMDGRWALRAAGLRNTMRMTWAGLRDELRRHAGADPFMIPLVGPPGSLAVMNQPGAEEGYRALFAPGQEFRNETAARVLLRVGSYRPIRRAHRIRCPWLVAACLPDEVTPARPALVAAHRAPLGETLRYDVAHFDVYVGTMFELTVADQLDFLRRHLVDGRRPVAPPLETTANRRRLAAA